MVRLQTNELIWTGDMDADMQLSNIRILEYFHQVRCREIQRRDKLMNSLCLFLTKGETEKENDFFTWNFNKEG